MLVRARALLPLIAVTLAALLGGAGGCGDGNTAPSLALVLDQQVVVGETLRVILTASDPDGDRLDFDVTGLPKTAQVTARAANEAVLVWSPLITDTQPGGRRYEVAISVDDSRGGSARAAIGVVVYPTFGVPAFTLPAGVVVNLGQRDDLELLVEVKDDDSTEVEIELLEGPDEAKLQRADKKVAHFFWQPNEEQRKVTVHRAIFSARDESHAPVTHVLTIVLLNAEKQSGCDGGPPTVVHQPPADASLAGPFELAATATDGQSQVQSFTLHWTRGDPNGTYAAAAFERVSPAGPDWRVALDPGALGALPSGGALVHYYLEATDNDDPTGVSCDQSTRFPKVGFFTAAVYPAGTPAETCADDLAEPDDVSGSGAVVKAGVYAGRRMCGASVDNLGVDAPAGTTVVAALVWNPAHGSLSMGLVDAAGGALASATSAGSGRLQVVYEKPDDNPVWVEVRGSFGVRSSYAIELTVEATRCEDDAAEPDSEPGQARTLTIDSEVAQKICAGDSDFFRVGVRAGQRLHLAAAFDHRYGDLDLELRAGDGVTVLATAASEKSLEEIEWTAESDGDVIFRVYGVEGASNSYTLIADQAASTGCQDDGLGDNVDAATATVLYQGLFEGFHACADAPDWFAIDLNGGETFSVLLLGQGQDRVSVRAYRDPAAAPIASGEPDGEGYAEISVVANGPETIYYEAVAQGATATYSLLQEVRDPPGACQPDRREPNAEGAPVSLDADTIHTWLRLCGDTDTDAFTINVPPFTTVFAFIAHAVGSSYTDLELQTLGGEVIVSESDPGDGPIIEHVIEQAGTYVLVVKPFDVPAEGLGYDLGLFLE